MQGWEDRLVPETLSVHDSCCGFLALLGFVLVFSLSDPNFTPTLPSLHKWQSYAQPAARMG